MSRANKILALLLIVVLTVPYFPALANFGHNEETEDSYTIADFYDEEDSDLAEHYIDADEFSMYDDSVEINDVDIERIDSIHDFATIDDEDFFFYLEPCEQIFATTTLDDDFVDNAVIVVFNRLTN